MWHLNTRIKLHVKGCLIIFDISGDTVIQSKKKGSILASMLDSIATVSESLQLQGELRKDFKSSGQIKA